MAKAMGVGVDCVLEWFTTNVDANYPYFSIWQSKNLLFSSKDEDYEKAKQLLEDNLRALEQNGYDEVLMIRLHYVPKREYAKIITASTPITATFTFRVIDVQPRGYVQPLQGYQPQPPSSHNSSLIIEKLNGIESRLNAFEDDEEENFEDAGVGNIQPQQPLNFYGILNNLLQNPEVQTRLIGMLGGVLNRLMPPTSPVANVAGIQNYSSMSEEEKLVQSINILKQVRPQIVDDLVGLANIAQTDPNKLSWILSMLPK
jgi:hypothetical protein